MKTVKTFPDIFSAHLAKGVLESGGIQAEVINENLLSVIPYGALVQLRPQLVVSDDDLETAIRALGLDKPSSGAVCRACGSTNVKFSVGGAKRKKRLLGQFLLIPMSVILGMLPLGTLTATCYCRDCGDESWD